jgi:hypothetical protein
MEMADPFEIQYRNSIRASVITISLLSIINESEWLFGTHTKPITQCGVRLPRLWSVLEKCGTLCHSHLTTACVKFGGEQANRIGYVLG